MGDNHAIARPVPASIGDMEAAKSPFSALLTRIFTIAALAVAMLAAAVYFWPRVSFWQQESLAKSLVAELEQSANPQIQVVLKQVASLGDPAIEALVIAATSERADIALAARRIVEEEFATWRIQAGRDEHFSLAETTGLLAAALSEHVEKFGPFGQQWATRLTLEIVELAEGFDVDDAVPVLADCSAVLAAVPALGPRMLTPDDPTPLGEPDRNTTPLPGMRVSALPSDLAAPSKKRSTPVSANPADPSVIVENPQELQELLESTAIPLGSNWTPEWTGQPKSVPAMPETTAAPAKSTPLAQEDVVEVPSPDEQAELIESLRPLPTRTLLTQLQEADPFHAAAIREVLVARGIAAEELILAARLFSEDVEARLMLVDDVKVLPARTARRWLRELLADTDGEVRLHALTALATTNDPELRSIARDIAIRDTDHRVAELASQIVRERR